MSVALKIPLIKSGGALTGTLIEDAFTDTNGTNITAHTIAPTNRVGASWAVSGTRAAQIQSNKATTGSGTGDVVAVVNATLSNVVLSGTINISGAGVLAAGMIARYSDTTHYWLILIYPALGLFKIFENNAGLTERASASITSSASVDYPISVTCSGTTISATFNNATTISYASATFNQTQTIHGVWISTNALTTTFDNFKVASL